MQTTMCLTIILLTCGHFQLRIKQQVGLFKIFQCSSHINNRLAQKKIFLLIDTENIFDKITVARDENTQNIRNKGVPWWSSG